MTKTGPSAFLFTHFLLVFKVVSMMVGRRVTNNSKNQSPLRISLVSISHIKLVVESKQEGVTRISEATPSKTSNGLS